MKQQPYKYRHNRSRQILKFKQFTAKVFGMLQNIYLTPLDPNLKSDVVYNVSSGSEVSIPNEVLSLKEDGKRMANKFLDKRVLTNEIHVFDTISKYLQKFSCKKKSSCLSKNPYNKMY